ncbi:glycosyltransferase family 4 protein [Curtobacterium sp. S6]|uniref:glycosyltransferase family 4 protein n=1 Tax=Curtobacterium sp. S6 TaxID=1479623 RepID=UPI00055B8C8D|nr:glycosyltransferase family 4 protein [Curtobacterium sp. S6]
MRAPNDPHGTPRGLSSDAPPKFRIGLAYHGDPWKETSWSGTPRGIGTALRRLGHDVVGLNAALPDRLDRRAQQVLAAPLMLSRPGELVSDPRIRHHLGRAKARVRMGAAYTRLGTWTMTRALKSAEELDLVIQIGTTFGVRHPRTVTFEDMTVRQGLDVSFPGWEGISQRAQDFRVAYQRRAYDDAVTCCAATPWAASSIVNDYGQPESKVFSVGLGINHASPATARRWETPRFLFIGKGWELKNGPTVLAAFARIRQEYPDARLDLVGHHPSVDLPGVHGHGFLSLADAQETTMLSELISRATCVVMPTRIEAAGIAHLEAAAAGIPSIGTSVGGARDIIGPSGITVTPGDVDDLTGAMRRMCDPEFARRLGAAGLERAPLFTWEMVAHRILQSAGLESVDDAAWQGLFTAPETTTA